MFFLRFVRLEEVSMGRVFRGKVEGVIKVLGWIVGSVFV